MNIRASLGLLASLALLSAACGGGAEPSGEAQGNQSKVAVLFPGLVDDGAYNEAGFQGVERAEQEGVEVAYTEQVTQDKQLEAFRNYAQQDFDVVIGYGGEFMDAGLRVAKDFPGIEFVVINGNESAENLTSVGPSFYEQGYLAGTLAASVTKSKKIGMVVAIEIPIGVDAEEGYEEGAAAVDPSVETSLTVTGDFVDADRAREATLTMINDGADVFWHFLDAADAGMFSAVEDHKDEGVRAIGLNFDQSEIAPDVILGSTLASLDNILFRLATDTEMLDHEVTYLGVGVGIVDITLAENVPDEAREKVAAAKESLEEQD
jgi:basic membrane protein A